MSQEFVLKEQQLSFNGRVRPQIPANLEHIGEIKAIGAASAPGPFWIFTPVVQGPAFGVAYLLNKLNFWNDLAVGALHQVEFKNAHKDAGPMLNFKINAMERKDKKIDIAIETHIIYTSAYGNQEKLNRWDPTASLFQDEVGFTIRPKDEKLVEINPKGVTPSTSLKEAVYSKQVTWGVEGGFNAGITADSEGVGASVGGDLKTSFSTSISSGTNMKDFEIKKKSDLGLVEIMWVSKMKNAYTDKGATPEAYDSGNMYDLVVDNNTTRWLKEPADAATSDIDLAYLATFSSIDPDLKNKQVEFEFTTVQRLMHVEILHRWGFSAARVGGVAVSIPYFIRTTGTIVLDLANRTVALKDTKSKGLNPKQLAEQNKKAIIYQHGYFQGHSQELVPGSYNINNLGIPNDSLSSLKVEKGLQVTLYEHANFQGRAKIFTGDTEWVGEDFNDITSSIKVELV